MWLVLAFYFIGLIIFLYVYGHFWKFLNLNYRSHEYACFGFVVIFFECVSVIWAFSKYANDSRKDEENREV